MRKKNRGQTTFYAKGILFKKAKKNSLLRAKIASMINVVCPLFSYISALLNFGDGGYFFTIT